MAASCHGCRHEKPAGEDVPGFLISHANREQREMVGLLFGRLGLHPLCHLSDTLLPLLDVGAMTEPPRLLGQQLCWIRPSPAGEGCGGPASLQQEVSMPSLDFFIGIKSAKSILPQKATAVSGMLCCPVLCSQAWCLQDVKNGNLLNLGKVVTSRSQ